MGLDHILSLLYSLFMEICEESSSNDIEFATDGSWHAISEKDGKECSPTTSVVNFLHGYNIAMCFTELAAAYVFPLFSLSPSVQATNLSTPPDRRLGSTPLTIRDTPERRGTGISNRKVPHLFLFVCLFVCL